MGFEWEYVLICTTHGEVQISELGGVGEGKKEIGNLDVFLTALLRVVLGGEREGRFVFAKDMNGKRPGELQNM